MAWEFAGGFINILGPVWNSTHTQHKLASLTANVARGSRRLTVSSTAGFSVGQWVRIMAAAPLAPAPASAAGRRLAAALLRRPPLSLQPRSGRRLQQAAPTGGSGGAPVGGLRLSPAAQRSWMASRAVADAMAANHEHEHGAVGAMPAADAAPAMLPAGTLDAWLHGENAVDSGTGAASQSLGLEVAGAGGKVSSTGSRGACLREPRLCPPGSEACLPPTTHTHSACRPVSFGAHPLCVPRGRRGRRLGGAGAAADPRSAHRLAGGCGAAVPAASELSARGTALQLQLPTALPCPRPRSSVFVSIQVGVYAFHQDVQHSGWEGFTLHFRHTPYPSHFVVEGRRMGWGGVGCRHRSQAQRRPGG